MKQLDEKIAARRVIALGLATYYTMRGYRHVAFSALTCGAEVTVFVDTEEEAQRAKEESKSNIIEDCKCAIRKWENECGEYFTYCVEY